MSEHVREQVCPRTPAASDQSQESGLSQGLAPWGSRERDGWAAEDACVHSWCTAWALKEPVVSYKLCPALLLLSPLAGPGMLGSFLGRTGVHTVPAAAKNMKPGVRLGPAGTSASRGGRAVEPLGAYKHTEAQLLAPTSRGCRG